MNFIELTGKDGEILIINFNHVSVVSANNDGGSILLLENGSHAIVIDSYESIRDTIDWRQRNA